MWWLNANVSGKAGFIWILQYVKYRFAVVIVVSFNLDEGRQEVVKLTPCHICHSSMYDALRVGGLISISGWVSVCLRCLVTVRSGVWFM